MLKTTRNFNFGDLTTGGEIFLVQDTKYCQKYGTTDEPCWDEGALLARTRRWVSPAQIRQKIKKYLTNLQFAICY